MKSNNHSVAEIGDCRTPLREALNRLSILDVWRAAGGGELRRGRGRAFWREGDGFNVAIDADKGVWHDFVSGEGGTAVSLVCVALTLTPGEAARWLIALAGVEDGPMTREARRERRTADLDAEDARLFGVAVVSLAEHCLEVDSLFNSDRITLTSLLVEIERDPLAVFREWRNAYPDLTSGLMLVGRRELERREIAAAVELREVFSHGA